MVYRTIMVRQVNQTQMYSVNSCSNVYLGRSQHPMKVICQSSEAR